MPGHTLDEILAVIDEEIAALQAKPVDAAELDRAKNQLESDTVRSLESLLARAERLQSYNYMVGDPGFLTEDLRTPALVDAAAIQRAAQQYLRKDGSAIVTIDPIPEAPIMERIPQAIAGRAPISRGGAARPCCPLSLRVRACPRAHPGAARESAAPAPAATAPRTRCPRRRARVSPASRRRTPRSGSSRPRGRRAHVQAPEAEALQAEERPRKCCWWTSTTCRSSTST